MLKIKKFLLFILIFLVFFVGCTQKNTKTLSSNSDESESNSAVSNETSAMEDMAIKDKPLIQKYSNNFNGHDEIGNLLLADLPKLFGVQCTGNPEDFPEGLDDIDTYILLKGLQFCNFLNPSLEQAPPVEITLTIDSVTQNGDNTEIYAYIGVGFQYDDKQMYQSDIGGSYYTVVLTDNKISKVISKDNSDLFRFYEQIETEEKNAGRELSFEEQKKIIDDYETEYRNQV